ncbi:MAG: ABC transporter ATP-binding protein/permease [Butyrivibrio sp.]|uniref:ABC transporter ATP-binding protein n=1 Tax=Butyrivibrio sp. TaxID=28121 RepID=UPI0025E3F068|nr:ABC transporter ATP-binding protein [Butyrivibrio sp.]MCR5772113.1 ABC transporter ATP-binding protein/permease [Butyrivibrio sp.]
MGKLKQYYKKYKSQKARGRDYFKWLYTYTKPYLGRIIALMIVSVLWTYIGIEYSIVSQKIIDMAGNGHITKSAIIVFMVLIIIMLVGQAFEDLFAALLNEKYSFGIRKQVYDKIIRSVWLGTQKFHTGDMMTRMTSDAGNIANGMVRVIPNIIVFLIELILVFSTLYTSSKLLAVTALFLTPIGIVLAYALGRKLKKYQIKVQESETAYRSFIQESLANILVVKAFSGEDRFSDELTNLRNSRFNWVWKKSKLSAASNLVMSGTFQLGYMFAFIYAAGQISRGEITFGTMTLFLTLFGRIQAPIASLMRELPGVVSIFASAGRVMDIQEIPLEDRFTDRDIKGTIGVKVNNLSFAYDKDFIFSDISFDIKPGDFVGIVGKSGIGKTTLIRLLMNFITPSSGDVYYYDTLGSKMQLSATVREFVSYVPQGNTLFSGTIRKNIQIGKEDATDEEIWEALDMAVCREFVEKLPNGLDTVIGEKGVGVSEGQAQRLGLARALIRKSEFVVLDEATSALDEDTESLLLKRLSELTPKPTCILITHRKSVLDYCNREFVLEDGSIKVKEIG